MRLSSPENDPTISFDMNATPKSIPLTSLFDTFAPETNLNIENTPNFSSTLLEDVMNDSIFGFMDNPYLQEPLNWNG
ncbi:hypothetical protein DH86_00002110 [Scytalidium sp. 3C]|nr:hypothetical protein DH86_00002110 [Scytalidium sp. 3C]